MAAVFLTSGFPDGFTGEFAERIKRYYSHQGSIVFVASDFDAHTKTERYAALFEKMFSAKGIRFAKAQVIDSRSSKEGAISCLNVADLVWLCGGDTLKQIASIKKYGIIPYLQKRSGITIGMSAGAINLAKRVILPKDEEDNIPELSIYDGIGLVDINIEPHLDLTRKKHLKDICEASHHATIYGLFDDSFIEIADDSTQFFGPYVKYEKNQDEAL